MKKMYFENASLELIRFSADVITTSDEYSPGGDSIETVQGAENKWTADNAFTFVGY